MYICIFIQIHAIYVFNFIYIYTTQNVKDIKYPAFYFNFAQSSDILLLLIFIVKILTFYRYYYQWSKEVKHQCYSFYQSIIAYMAMIIDS